MVRIYVVITMHFYWNLDFVWRVANAWCCRVSEIGAALTKILDRVISGNVGELFGSGCNCNFIKRVTEMKVESMIISFILHEPILKNKAQHNLPNEVILSEFF